MCLHPQSNYVHKFVDTPSCAQEGVPKKEAAFHTKDPHLFVTSVYEREKGGEGKQGRKTNTAEICLLSLSYISPSIVYIVQIEVLSSTNVQKVSPTKPKAS